MNKGEQIFSGLRKFSSRERREVLERSRLGVEWEFTDEFKI